MTRYAMVVDLNRCVGCQTCTAACKHANATSPGVQWRRVLDVETGEFPEVRRAFVPVGCMHCEDPPCVDVCPSTATRKRGDGLVTIDYDLCIGCAYCAVACPYQARFKVEQPRYAYGARRMKHEVQREDHRRIGVAQKCTFCIERIDAGTAKRLVPGAAPEATPACAASCIAEALQFGDLDDPKSNVSRLVTSHKTFRMHEELGTRPNLIYLWDRKRAANDDPPAIESSAPHMTADAPEGVAPWAQQSWDVRAAANFMGGGAGVGLLAACALAGIAGTAIPVLPLVALLLIGAGLFCVWLEIGRPFRFLNVFLHPQSSWMTREAITALPLFCLGAFALVTPTPRLSALLTTLTAAVGLVFLYCQARILQAAKGIPAWREPAVVPLIIGTGLAEGAGFFLAVWSVYAPREMLTRGMAVALMLLLAFRLIAWRRYRGALRHRGAPVGTHAALERHRHLFEVATHLVPVGLATAGLLVPALTIPAFVIAGLLAFAGGWGLKYTLVVRAAFNQGFAIPRMPARGAGTSAPGIKPGWSKG